MAITAWTQKHIKEQESLAPSSEEVDTLEVFLATGASQVLLSSSSSGPSLAQDL